MIKEDIFLYGTGFKGLVHAISTNVRVSAFIIDETVIQVGNQKYWVIDLYRTNK
jgi:hypothetical protein